MWPRGSFAQRACQNVILFEHLVCCIQSWFRVNSYSCFLFIASGDDWFRLICCWLRLIHIAMKSSLKVIVVVDVHVLHSAATFDGKPQKAPDGWNKWKRSSFQYKHVLLHSIHMPKLRIVPAEWNIIVPLRWPTEAEVWQLKCRLADWCQNDCNYGQQKCWNLYRKCYAWSNA